MLVPYSVYNDHEKMNLGRKHLQYHWMPFNSVQSVYPERTAQSVARVTYRALAKSKVGFVKERGKGGHYVILTELKNISDYHGELMNLLDLLQLYIKTRVQ